MPKKFLDDAGLQHLLRVLPGGPVSTIPTVPTPADLPSVPGNVAIAENPAEVVTDTPLDAWVTEEGDDGHGDPYAFSVQSFDPPITLLAREAPVNDLPFSGYYDIQVELLGDLTQTVVTLVSGDLPDDMGSFWFANIVTVVYSPDLDDWVQESFTYALETVPEEVMGVEIPAGWNRLTMTEVEVDNETEYSYEFEPAIVEEIGPIYANEAAARFSDENESTFLPEGAEGILSQLFNAITISPAGLYASVNDTWTFIGPAAAAGNLRRRILREGPDYSCTAELLYDESDPPEENGAQLAISFSQPVGLLDEFEAQFEVDPSTLPVPMDPEFPPVYGRMRFSRKDRVVLMRFMSDLNNPTMQLLMEHFSAYLLSEVPLRAEWSGNAVTISISNDINEDMKPFVFIFAVALVYSGIPSIQKTEVIGGRAA